MCCYLGRLYVWLLNSWVVVIEMLTEKQDLDKDDYIPPPFSLASATEVHGLIVQQANERKDKEKRKQKKLGEHGFEVEHTGEILF